MSRIAVALSGGGHRATVWGLGTLLRLVDCGSNGKVVSIASVSGGSIANGVVAQQLEYSRASVQEFEAAVAPSLRHMAHEGLFFFGRPTNRYTYSVLLMGVVTLLLFASVLALPLLQAFDRTLPSVAIVFACVGFLVCLYSTIRLFSQRSEVVDRALARVHFRDAQGQPTRLRDVDRTVHHVFCATELQAADHFYFTPRAVYSYRFGVGVAGDLPLSTAVQCSAALPGGFPPRTLAAQLFDFCKPDYVDEPSNPPEKVVLTDGGVYDNMADQWEQGFGARTRRWPELAGLQPAADVLIVANASAGWTWKPLARLGRIRAEIVGLLRTVLIMYDVTTARRRLHLVDLFTAAETQGRGLRGVLVHIAQSPYTVPDRFLRDPDKERAARAAEAIAFLGDTDSARSCWHTRALQSAAIGTVLNALGQNTIVNLLEHAYVVTMVNMYVVLGIGRLETVDRARFESLCAK